MTRDLMFRDEIEEIVASSYSQLEMPGGPSLDFYADHQLDGVPDGARDWALGLGNPLAYAGIRPGETMLDLGSGSGIDVLIAAKRVGHDGRRLGAVLEVPLDDGAVTAHAGCQVGDCLRLSGGVSYG